MDNLSISTSTPTTQFRMQIDCFSTLSTYFSSMDRYESCEFEACGYKWKLALYARGNKEKNGKDHISLYLISVDMINNIFDYYTSSDYCEDEILVSFNLFVLDQIRDKYLKVEGLTCLHGLKRESGFDKFLPLEIFKDPSNGYLLHDTCMFGAEVCFVQHIIRPESLTMNKSITNDHSFEYTWKIEKFSKLEDRSYYSQKFTGGGYDWKLVLFPKGNKEGQGNSLSLFLALADPHKLPLGEVVHVTFRFRVIDQITGFDKERVMLGGVCMDASTKGMGWNQFMPLGELNESVRYLANDTCIVHADVDVGDEESIKERCW